MFRRQMSEARGSSLQSMQQATSTALQRVNMGCENVEALSAQTQAAHDSSPSGGATAVAMNTSALCPRGACMVEEADRTGWNSIQVCVKGDATTIRRNGSINIRRTPDFARCSLDIIQSYRRASAQPEPIILRYIDGCNSHLCSICGMMSLWGSEARPRQVTSSAKESGYAKRTL